MSKRHPNRIVVPQRPVQGGFDMKFESDPYEVESMLTIERRQAAQPEESPQHPMAHAEFVSDVEEIPPQPPSGSINMPPPSTRQATNTRGSSTIGHSIV